jgi:histidine ammonia-lyase
MTVVLEAREDFTLAAFRRVTVDGEDAVFGPAALAVMAASRAGFEQLLHSGSQGFIYGVTTRPGVEVSTAIPPGDWRSYASRFRGVGRGFGRDHLDERVARGIVFARLADFVGGHAKVRPELARQVAALLGAPLPRLPLDGQTGAGEILPLMHLMAAIDGDLVEGEGMALINGSPCATALVCDVALHAEHRLSLAEAIFALAIEAYRAPLDAYDKALDELHGDEAERAVLQHLRGYLDGASTPARLMHQAPVSFRILPQVLGQAQRAVQTVEHAATAALGSVTENPVYLAADADHPSGRVLSAGGFHNGAAAPAMNWLTAAWADLALVAQRQMTAMHGPASGLPHLLAPAGFIAGASGGATNLFGWVATGLVEEARLLASPALLPASINDSQNDIASPAFGAYRSQARAAECLDSVLAILALVSSQALFVTDRRPAPPLLGLLAGIRSVFPPVETERPGQGTEAGELADILHRAALTGRLDFPGYSGLAGSPEPPEPSGTRP